MFGSSEAETSATLLLTVRSIHRLILKIKNKSNKHVRNVVEGPTHFPHSVLIQLPSVNDLIR